MASDSAIEIRVGAPGNVIEIEVGQVEVDVPRSVGYFGGLAATVGIGLIEPPLAVFIAAVSLFKPMTNSALPIAVRVIGEALEGAAKPVGSDAQRVVQLRDQRQSDTKVIELRLNNAGARGLAANTTPRCARRPSAARVRPSMQRILDGIVGAPAWVHNDRLDFLAAKRLGYALYSEMFADPARPVNSARFMFLNPRSHDFYVDWERVAYTTVAILRGAAGRNPSDKTLSNLIGELSTRSEDFHTRLAAHDVRLHRTGVKKRHHPIVGDRDLILGRNGTARRSRPDDVRLHSRTRNAVRRRAQNSWRAGQPPRS